MRGLLKIKTALLVVVITTLTLCIIPQPAVNKEIDKTVMVITSDIKSTLARPQLVDRNRNKIEGSFEAEKQEKVPVIIGFKETPNPHLVVSVGGEIKCVYRITPAIAAKVPEAAVSKLRSAMGVAYVEPDGEVYALEQTLPWGVDRIDAEKIHTLGGKGATIKVAILDTGIDYNHPDLDANYKGGHDYVNDDPDPMDDNGHGTHVAGIVAAEDNDIGVIGVAPEAHLYAVKVLDAGGSGYVSDVVAGIQWSIDNGMQIISMSLGTDTDYQSLHDAVDAAYYDNGILVVAAAGNDGNPAGTGDNVDYPARYDSVIAVGATDENDERAVWVGGASSTGPDLELAAPGDKINSTLLGGGYGTKSGTSMSCPHVTGTAALVFSLLDIDPSDDLDGDGVWDANEVRKKLQDTAEDLGAAGRDTYYGYGLVDAEAAATPPPGASPPYYIPELPYGTILALLTALLITAVYRRRRELAALPRWLNTFFP